MTSTGAVCIERDSWLGHRWLCHHLGQGGKDEALDDLLLLGMQASRQSGGEHPLSQRTSRIGATPLARAITPDVRW